MKSSFLLALVALAISAQAAPTSAVPGVSDLGAVVSGLGPRGGDPYTPTGDVANAVGGGADAPDLSDDPNGPADTGATKTPADDAIPNPPVDTDSTKDTLAFANTEDMKKRDGDPVGKAEKKADDVGAGGKTKGKNAADGAKKKADGAKKKANGAKQTDGSKKKTDGAGKKADDVVKGGEKTNAGDVAGKDKGGKDVGDAAGKANGAADNAKNAGGK